MNAPTPPQFVLLLIVIIAATAGGGDKTSSPAASAGRAATGGTPCAADYADKQPEDVCADTNGTVTLQGLTVTVTPLKSDSNGIGGRSVCTDVTLKNDSGESKDYNAHIFKDPDAEW